MEKLLEALAKIPPALERKFDGMYLSSDSLTALKKLLGAEDKHISYIVGSLSDIEVCIRSQVPLGTAILWKCGKPLSECWWEPFNFLETIPKVVGVLDFTKELQDDNSE